MTAELTKLSPSELAAILSTAWQIGCGIAVAVFLLILWCVRLEAKVLGQDKDLIRLAIEQKELHNEQSEKVESMWKKVDILQGTMNIVLQTVARMEGKLDAKSK